MECKLAKKLLAISFCSCLLVGCTTQIRGEVKPSPSPAPTAAPASTPAQETMPPLEYEMLALPLTPQPPEIYDSQFMPREDTQDHRASGYAFIEALYTNDAQKLRSVLSDSVLNSGLPLPDLTGLVITEVYLAGGVYEVPFATLTVADPGATGLAAGSHEFRFSFDEEGKVDGFCMWFDLEEATARAMGLDSGPWMSIGTLDVTYEQQGDLQLRNEIMVVGRKLDALGFSVGEVRAFSIEEQTSYEEGGAQEYKMTSCQELPGDWPVPRDSREQYARPPVGNCLTHAELASVCDQLNTLFTQLRDGTYTWEWEEDPHQAALHLWNPAHPVPVAVTPEALRSVERSWPNPDIAPQTQVWVPLPDQCWAVCSLTEEGKVDDFLGFSFALECP